jgi:hypothetical protein
MYSIQPRSVMRNRERDQGRDGVEPTNPDGFLVTQANFSEMRTACRANL